MSRPYLPTVVIRDEHENPRKCSILPLRGRPDMVFYHYPLKQLPLLEGYVRLAADGPVLSPEDAGSGILLLDASWSWAQPMNRFFAHVPARSLHGFQSAYPRVSKRGDDPANGLATVEALYVAYRILGRPTDGLLAHYHWRQAFLDLNGWTDDAALVPLPALRESSPSP